jgi:hypothetical protein
MATGLNVTGDAIVSGNLRLGGTLSPPIDKANILALARAQSFPIPLTDFRVWDAMQTPLPGTPATDDLGLVGGTFGTATPTLRTQDLKTAGAKQQPCAGSRAIAVGVRRRTKHLAAF